jgi:hypothetical protein
MQRDAEKKEREKPRKKSADSIKPFPRAQQKKEENKPKGFGGIFGAVLNNPIAKGLLVPLEVLDTPRRMVLSGTKEVADIITGNGDASFGDYWEQSNDPSFGFGDQVDTGNEWVDRALGFTGDVLADPLTYVTGGAGRFLGQSGRLAAGTQLAERGLEDAAERAARLGVSHLSPGERAVIGLERGGLRFMGKRIGGNTGLGRVNEAVAGAVTRPLESARAGIRGSRLGQRVGGARVAPELEEAIQRLATGKGALGADEALGLVARKGADEAAKNLYHGQFMREAQRLAAKTSHRGTRLPNKSAREQITSALAKGTVPADPHLAQVADEYRTLLRTARDQEVAAGLKVPHRANYVPQAQTKYGEEVLGRQPQAAIRSNKAGAGGFQKARTFSPGQDYMFDGVKVRFHTADPAEMNRTLKTQVPSITDDVFETDIAKLVDRRIQSGARSVGRVSGLDRMAQIGVADPVPAAIPKLNPQQLQANINAYLSGQIPNLPPHNIPSPPVPAGMERIGRELTGTGYDVSRPIANAMRSMEREYQSGALANIVNGYTQFFKTYATATPGFHVRNVMDGIFRNFTDGVSVHNQMRGFELWGDFAKSNFDMPKFLATQPAAERTKIQKALTAVHGAGGGGGQYHADEIALETMGRVTNNAFTRASRRIGENAEGRLRMGMALDTIERGGSVEEAMARVKRVQFDYSEVSDFDRIAKKVIPFWTFMSRNIPFQIQQMWLKPRAYAIMESFKRNMGEDYEGDMVPLTWQQGDAFQLGEDSSFYLDPDLSYERLQEDIEKFGDPALFFQALNPLFRVPLETLVMDRKLYGDRPFVEGGVDEIPVLLRPLQPILSALGQTATAGGGQTVADEKLIYALQELFPLVGQVDRVAPQLGSDEYMQERTLQNRLNYLGIPVKELTPGQTEAEKRRRKRQGEKDRDWEEARERALERYGS